MGEIEKSLEKAKWIVELIGYDYDELDNGNYDILSGEYCVGGIFCNDDRYEIKINYDDVYYADQHGSEYFIDKLKGKNKNYAVCISVDDKETTIKLYIPNRNDSFRKELSLSFRQSKAFRIVYEGKIVELSDNSYTIETPSETKTITESRQEAGVLHIAKQKRGRDKCGDRYPVKSSSINQTLAEYISSDETGTELFQKFSGIFAKFGFTKSLVEVMGGEEIFASSGLALFGNLSDSEKASGVQKKKTDDKKKKTGE